MLSAIEQLSIQAESEEGARQDELLESMRTPRLAIVSTPHVLREAMLT